MMGMNMMHPRIKTILCALLLATAMPIMAAPAAPATQAVAAPVWIDVRTPAEYAEGHLPESYNIPLQEFERLFPQQVKDKNAIVALSCRSGNRSGKALSVAQAMGYTRAFNAGGYAALKQTRQSP